MLKKAITYNNLFTDEPVTEEFYFNLTEVELFELEIATKGGWAENMQELMNSEDQGAIYLEFKRLILLAYGEKGADGKSFIKTQELRDTFVSSSAFEALVMEITQVEGALAEFVKGVFPKRLVKQEEEKLDAILKPETLKTDDNQLELVPPVEPSWPRRDEERPRKLSQDEVTSMDADDLKSGLAEGRYVM